MFLQILVLWIVVGLIVVWFVKSEQRRRDENERVGAAAHPLAPLRRLVGKKVEVTPPRLVRRPVFSEAELKFISLLGKTDQRD